MTVTAIIPAYNEEARIAVTILALRTVSGLDQIIVVDDGSTDSTAAAAESAGADVLVLERNLGKGGAMNAGARAAAGDVLLFLDADLGGTAAEAGKLLEPVLNGDADMTIAQFHSGTEKGGGFGLAVGLARIGIRFFTGRKMRSPLSGQRALRKEVWEKVGGIAPGFGAEVALTIDTVKCGFRVVEVAVEMTHRVTRRDWNGIRHRARQFADIAKSLIGRRAVRK